MKPKDYQRYALSIDFFSDPTRNKDIGRFVELSSRSLPPSAKICDVGGGTGFILQQILQNRNDLSATLIEPSKAMYRQAESRLSSNATLINATLQESLPSLQHMDAFLFCRSLYAFFNKLDDYKNLFLQLAATLLPYGQLYIFEPNQIYDIPTYKRDLESKLNEKRDIFNQHWPNLELALRRFNNGVTTGEFTLFSTDELKTLGQKTGFELIYYGSPNLYCFRKHGHSADQPQPSKFA